MQIKSRVLAIMHRSITALIRYNDKFQKHRNPLFLDFPAITAALADTNAFLDIYGFLFLSGKNLNNQRRYSKAQPFERNPPPAYTKPPKETVMLVFELDLIHDLHIHDAASTLRAYHNNHPFYC